VIVICRIECQKQPVRARSRCCV